MVDLRKGPYSDDAEALSARLNSSLNRTAPRSPAEALQPESVPPPPPRSRAVRHPVAVFLNVLVTVIVVGVLLIGGSVYFAKSRFDSASSIDAPRTFTVAHGTGLSTIADELVKDGIIDTKWLFVFGVWLSNQTTSLKAGEYLIPAHASMRDIMDTMVTGKGILYSVTIPEGLTSQQIVDRLKANNVLTGDITQVPAEGSLLPETYKFTRGDTRQDIIDRMAGERDRVLADVWSRRAPDLPIKTPAELVTLASIVEKETALSDERSRVAAVFINRLKLNMRLQSDPTVIYGMFGGAGKPADFVLTRKDLETPTPYNTYVIPALPPGPIANPGRASLEAVANPSRTRDLYFVADGSGGHAFAASYEQHLRNVAHWRDITAANGNATDAAASEAGTNGTAAGDGQTAPLALSPAQVPVPAPKPQ
jgi:UPF0755 protein